MLKLVASNGAQSYVPLTLRDDSSHAALVIQNSVTTWQAYNDWGGYSLYHGPGGSFGTRSRVSCRSIVHTWRRRGSADFFWIESPLVFLAERLGLDVTYWTDIDLHERPGLLMNHRALVSLGHDEYWSSDMRRGALAARGPRGQPRVPRRERRLPAHPPRRVAAREGPSEVNYKVASEDPMLRGRQRGGHLTVARGARAASGERAARRALPVQPGAADMVVAAASSWVFAGTGMANGDRLPGRDRPGVRPCGRQPADAGVRPDPGSLAPHVPGHGDDAD